MIEVSGTTATLSGLADDATYWWKVRAWDTDGNYAWSAETFHFDVYIPEAPGAFSLSAPEDGSTLDSDSVTVSWTASADPDPDDVIRYIVEWSVNEDFSESYSAETEAGAHEYTITGLEGSAQAVAALRVKPEGRGEPGGEDADVPRGTPATDELPDNSTVYWRVKAVDSFGLETWADPGTGGWSFNIDVINAPLAFSLIAPENELVLDTLSWEFAWYSTTDPDPGDAITYWLEVSMAEDFADSANAFYRAGGDTSFTVPYLADDRAYWWRVHAEDTNSEGTYSTEAWSFLTFWPQAPSPFALGPTESDTLILGDELHFIWQSSGDPDPGEEVTYSVFLNVSFNDSETDETIDTLLTISDLADTTLAINLEDYITPPSNSDGFGNVDWWVTAISLEDEIESNERFSFVLTVQTTAVENNPFSEIPTDYSIKSAYPNPFNAMTNVVIGLPQSSQLKVRVFNMLGRQVSVITSGQYRAGYHRFVLNADTLPSGIYFIQAIVPGKLNQVRKVMLVR